MEKYLPFTSSSIVSFWLTNNTEKNQTIYYNIFIKDTTGDILTNTALYFFEMFFGNDTNSEERKESKINHIELYKFVSTALKNDNIEDKIRGMERNYARKYIKEKVKDTLENYFGELSNGQDKTLKYFITLFTDIYIYSNPYFFVS